MILNSRIFDLLNPFFAKTDNSCHFLLPDYYLTNPILYLLRQTFSESAPEQACQRPLGQRLRCGAYPFTSY